MKETNPAQPIHIEPRWPVMLTVLAVLIMVTMMSSRIRPMPHWFPYAIVAGLMIPLAGVRLSRGHPLWLRAERIATLVFFLVIEAMILGTLVFLIVEMLNQPKEFSGRQLLTSSITAWITNMMAFSLVYWQMDRGGPEARINNKVRWPDLHFPQYEFLEESPPGWRPIYVDYLFHSYSTSTAFSAADVIPLTIRTKLLMMVESMISLMILAVIASRAISLLG